MKPKRIVKRDLVKWVRLIVPMIPPIAGRVITTTESTNVFAYVKKLLVSCMIFLSYIKIINEAHAERAVLMLAA